MLAQISKKAFTTVKAEKNWQKSLSIEDINQHSAQILKELPKDVFHDGKLFLEKKVL